APTRSKTSAWPSPQLNPIMPEARTEGRRARTIETAATWSVSSAWRSPSTKPNPRMVNISVSGMKKRDPVRSGLIPRADPGHVSPRARAFLGADLLGADRYRSSCHRVARLVPGLCVFRRPDLVELPILL